MKRLTIGSTCTIDTAELQEFSPDQPGPHEVAISVAFSGLGLIDALQASGAMGDTTGHTPGLEVEGIVAATGSAVTGLAVGDRVAAICVGGGLSSHVITDENMVVSLDDRVPEGLGAVCLVNSLTAWGALDKARVTGRFEKVIVHAGTGGLGSQFGQVARLFGATEIHAVVGSDRKARVASGLGYDQVWRRQDLAAVPDSAFDVAVDTVGGAATTSSWVSLRNGGRVLKVGNGSGAAPAHFDSLSFWFENKSVLGFNVGEWISEDPVRARTGIEWCVEQVSTKELRVPYEIRPVTRIRSALQDLLEAPSPESWSSPGDDPPPDVFAGPFHSVAGAERRRQFIESPTLLTAEHQVRGCEVLPQMDPATRPRDRDDVLRQTQQPCQ